ncbi:MAG: OmpA family protein [Kofleriaceae bacterium]|nr:OmpA family protein [Kofleriaceae bacterium]
MNTQTKLLLLALATTLAMGCGIKKGVHQKVLNELTSTQLELDETRGERDELLGDRKKLRSDKEQLTSDKASLSDSLDSTSKAEAEASARAAKLAADMQATEAELLELRKQRVASDKRLAAFRVLTAKFKSLVDTGKLKVVFRQGQMVLELPSGVLFSSGQAKLSSGGEAALSEVLDVLKNFTDRRFLIAGHTDNIPVKSRKFRNNWLLSTARAVSVVLYMTDSAGFPAGKLAAAGYGEFAPVSDNTSPEGRAQNRRIEIILVPDLSELPGLNAE